MPNAPITGCKHCRRPTHIMRASGLCHRCDATDRAHNLTAKTLVMMNDIDGELEWIDT